MSMPTNIIRNRPLIACRSNVNVVRTHERRRILRALGVENSRDITRIACMAARFDEKLRQLGQPDDVHVALRVPLQGGHQRVGTPAAAVRQARYRWLRDQGWGAVEATMGSKTDGTFQRSQRRLALGLGYR